MGNEGLNGLHMACKMGHVLIIPILIEAGININAQGNRGCNALYYACKHYLWENPIISKLIIKLLIDAGINIPRQDDDSCNALDHEFISYTQLQANNARFGIPTWLN